ncbi:universal stress protein [Streptomyces sp. NPDC051051]|uniref:universal stress protein n=1 Tax=Streptomyces sp. NPDC051051 TaxID=3155666 RepID=UPI00341E3AB9
MTHHHQHQERAVVRERVVVGVDGSLVSVRALDRAADEAARRRCPLRVVYAVPDRDEAAPVLASSVSRVADRHPALAVETVAAESGAARALADASGSAALTVVGTRGLGGFGGLLFGSVSLRVAAHTHGPLLVVRGDHADGSGGDVLLHLPDDADAAVADYAFEEARRRGARLRVLHTPAHRHVLPELPSLVPATSPGQERLVRRERADEAVPRFGLAALRDLHPQVEVVADTVRTGPAHALLEATRDAAVVVIGVRRSDGRPGPHPGAVGPTLLHRSHCPVVVVPAG